MTAVLALVVRWWGQSAGIDTAQAHVESAPIVTAAVAYAGLEACIFEERGLNVTPSTVQNTSTAIPAQIRQQRSTTQ